MEEMCWFIARYEMGIDDTEFSDLELLFPGAKILPACRPTVTDRQGRK
jgi:hypothetical protein